MIKTIGGILVILAASFGAWFFIDGKKADCEDVQKVEQKVEGIQKQMDFKFKHLELKTVEERIYDTEKRYGSTPTSSEKKADLEKLRREREQVIREMEEIKKK